VTPRPAPARPRPRCRPRRTLLPRRWQGWRPSARRWGRRRPLPPRRWTRPGRSAPRAAQPDPGQLRAEADRARAVLADARTRNAAAARALDEAVRDSAAHRARRAVLAQERAEWSRRAAEAARRVADLRARRAEAGQNQARLRGEPTGTAGQVEAAALLQQAEDAHRAAVATAQATRTADAALAQAREECIRAEAAFGQAEQAWAALPPTAEQPVHGATPAHPAAPTLPPDLSAGAEARARAGLAALLRQRDALGPVNLRAEVEAAAVDAALQATTRDRDELAAAIAALRGSLGQLDREARARLTAVFQQVDVQFQVLFSRMFGGGRAHLALVESDDPLQAGLEIYAQPPGKRLSALSLLSGGEQALAALILIFAVFRCNPAPVCVLDEVDAPLDDANVERLCGLLAELARHRDAVPRGDASRADHGAHGPAVWRDHAGARRVVAAVGGPRPGRRMGRSPCSRVARRWTRPWPRQCRMTCCASSRRSSSPVCSR